MWEGEVLHYQLMTVHEVKLASICLGGKTVIFHSFLLNFWSRLQMMRIPRRQSVERFIFFLLKYKLQTGQEPCDCGQQRSLQLRQRETRGPSALNQHLTLGR